MFHLNKTKVYTKFSFQAYDYSNIRISINYFQTLPPYNKSFAKLANSERSPFSRRTWA